MDVNGRTCTICGVYQGWDNYGIDKFVKSGHRSNCKECEAKKKKSYYELNKTKILEQHKNYYTRLKENFDGRY